MKSIEQLYQEVLGSEELKKEFAQAVHENRVEDFLKKNQIEIAVLTIPKTKALEVANTLVNNGVRAIWNFAHLDLELPDDVVVENVHLSDSLMQLSYNIVRRQDDK